MLNLLVQKRILVLVIVRYGHQVPAFVPSAYLFSLVPCSSVIAGQYYLVRVFTVFKNCEKRVTSALVTLSVLKRFVNKKVKK